MANTSEVEHECSALFPNMIRNILVLVFLLPRWIWCSCPNTWRLLGFSVLGAFPTSHSSNMGDSRRIGVKQVLLRQRQIQRSSRNFTESDLLRMGWKSRKDASGVFHTYSSRYMIILHVLYLCSGRIEEVHDNCYWSVRWGENQDKTLSCFHTVE